MKAEPMTTDIDPPVILANLANHIDSALVNAERVKKVWDEERLFRLAAVMALNKLTKYDEIITTNSKIAGVTHNLREVMKNPHLFFALLGVTIKSTK